MREVCYLGIEEMYFADTLEEEPLNPQQRAMALRYYMTPVVQPTSGFARKSGGSLADRRRRNRLMYEEELRRARREVRLGEVLGEDRARV